MAKAKQPVQLTNGALRPVVVKNATEAGDVAFDGSRKRPIVAINEDGKMVVCCRRTASKNGWEIQGALHQRPGRDGKKARVVINEKGKMAQRKADAVSVEEILAAPTPEPHRAAVRGVGRRATDKVAAAVLVEKAAEIVAAAAVDGPAS
jgi:hypothetical protein